jgi:TM2 domain-containing membrane protein YozV
VSTKSRLATSLLAILLGRFGAHRFYTGKIGTAVVMLMMGAVSLICLFVAWIGPLAAGGDRPGWGLLAIGYLLSLAVGIWALIDFVIAVTGNFKDSLGKPISKW